MNVRVADNPGVAIVSPEDLAALVGAGGGDPAVAAATGATTDPALSWDAPGTVSGKLRGLVKILASVWDSTNNRLKVDGSSVTQPVSGSVSVSNLPATQPVTGSFYQATQPVSGSVAVSNLPVSQPVTGSFYPATQPVSGTVTANAGAGPWPVTDNGGSVTVDGAVSVSNLPATQPVSGTVAVSNLPATQPVSGTVAVSNLPASQAVTGTFWQATQPVSGSVTASVSNFPATQITRETPTTSIGTAVSAANTAVTLTLAAAGAGVFHYITALEIVNATATAITGTALLTYTTTNLNSLAWTAGNALAVGTDKAVTRIQFEQPVRSAVANTATTIVAPAIGAGGVCRITAYYYTA